MSVITFDTLEYVKTLEAAGVSPEHAEAQVKALSTVLKTNLNDVSTKDDLTQMENRFDTKLDKLGSELRLEISEIKSEQKVMKWMLGVIVAGVVVLILKAFF